MKEFRWYLQALLFWGSRVSSLTSFTVAFIFSSFEGAFVSVNTSRWRKIRRQFFLEWRCIELNSNVSWYLGKNLIGQRLKTPLHQYMYRSKMTDCSGFCNSCNYISSSHLFMLNQTCLFCLGVTWSLLVKVPSSDNVPLSKLCASGCRIWRHTRGTNLPHRLRWVVKMLIASKF